MKRLGLADKHFWTTQYDPDEMYPAGEYPNQSSGVRGFQSGLSKTVRLQTKIL